MRIKRFKDAQAANSGGFRTLSGAISERTAGTVRGQAGVYQMGKAGGLLRRAGGSSSVGGVSGVPPLSSTVGGVRPSGPVSAAAATAALSGAGSAAARRVVARATGTSAAMALPQLPRVPSPAANEFLLLPDTQSLANLDGSLPGYAAFDPLGLYNSEYAGTLLDPRWLALAEVMHSRWAMLGVVGCIAPELGAVLSNGGHRAASAEWFRSGWLPPGALPRAEATAGPHYWADPGQLFVLQVVVMAIAEGARFADYASPGSVGLACRRAGLPLNVAKAFDGSSDTVNRAYPGGPLFNPAPLVESPAAMSQLALAEVKHGRLAMLAMMGLGAQAVLTGAGPVFNLVDHLRSPLGANIFSNLAAMP